MGRRDFMDVSGRLGRVLGRLGSSIRGQREGPGKKPAGAAAPSGASLGAGQARMVRPGRQVPQVDGTERAQDLAALMFGRDFSSAPARWDRASVCGIVTAHLCESLPVEDTVIALAPGWAQAAVKHYDCHFFVVETAALYRGVWCGALEPGGEHLLAEILDVVETAKDRLMTPLLIENHRLQSETAGRPSSLPLSTPLQRLRGVMPARLVSAEVPESDPYAPAPSALLYALTRYAREDGAQ